MMVAWTQVVTLEIMRNRILDIFESTGKRSCCWNGCGVRERIIKCDSKVFDLSGTMSFTKMGKLLGPE